MSVQQEGERAFQAIQMAATLPEDVAYFLSGLTDEELAVVAQVTGAVHAAATTAQTSRRFAQMWIESASASVAAPAVPDSGTWPSRTTHLLGELVASMGAADGRSAPPVSPAPVSVAPAELTGQVAGQVAAPVVDMPPDAAATTQVIPSVPAGPDPDTTTAPAAAAATRTTAPTEETTQ